MTTYAEILLLAIPFFLILLIIEAFYGWVSGSQTLRSFDTISSLSSGITNLLKDVLGLTFIIIGYSWLYEHIALFNWEASFVIYFIAFILTDFAGYVKHFLAHKINYFWNEHVIHHSSEEFNLACALRQSISAFFSIKSFLLIPAAILGMPPKIVAMIAPLHLFLQFWYHTRHIPKLGFLEYIIVTPSQHRVHHAVNPQYLDKNLGQIFPWWDKLFGTFQEELDDTPCIYGTKKPVRTWNPTVINFQHLWLLTLDAWRTEDWSAKLTIWFRPTGWRPQDLATKYPLVLIDNPINQIKYDVSASKPLHFWSWTQLLFTHAFILHMLINFESIGFPNLFVYAGFIFIHINSYTTLMDMNKLAIVFDIAKSMLAFWWVLLQSGDWFGLNTILDWGALFVLFYTVISVLITVWFVSNKKSPNIS